MKNKFLIICIVLFICLTVTCLTKVVVAKNEFNKNLFSKIIYIDAGHGGKDNGASFNGVVEDEINLKIAGYIVENLIDLGVYVLTSRTSDYDLSNIYNKNKKRVDLLNRVKQINNSKPDLFLSIHLNSYSSGLIRGGQVFYQKNDNSKQLADSIQKKLNVLSIGKDRKIKEGDYYLLNKTNPIGVLIECGFLSNDEERSKLVSVDYQKKIAKKIVEGIVDYFSILGD